MYSAFNRIQTSTLNKTSTLSGHNNWSILKLVLNRKLVYKLFLKMMAQEILFHFWLIPGAAQTEQTENSIKTQLENLGVACFLKHRM